MEELDSYQLDLVGLQETRWPFNGKLNSSSHTLFYSGCDDGNHYAGVGIAVRKTFMESVMTFEPVNERLCYIRLKGKFQNISVICFYAPTEDAEDDVKDFFYDNLDQLMTSIPDYDMKILLGDANAKVGNEPSWKQYTGGNSLHETTNENGMRLISFASAKNLKIMSTTFPRKDIHKYTWVSPNGQVKNQIDHVLTEDRHKSCITDVRSKRGAECGTDHYLIIIKVRQKVCKNRRDIHKTKQKFDLKKLDNPNIRKEFMIKLSNRFQALEKEEEDSIEGKWKVIRDSIQEIGKEVVGFQNNRKNKKTWFNEDCRQMIEERKKAKAGLLTDDNHEKREEYLRINRKTNKTLRTAKRNFVKDQLKKAEEDRTNNNSREFFRSSQSIRIGGEMYAKLDRNSFNVLQVDGVIELPLFVDLVHDKPSTFEKTCTPNHPI
ncbi:craniofacial development protein 2-like [Ischnura elegans]|uniref:craniofacial development protein 2-like n=1 Tax=Ischnura elegans TaxID=197161 RepID=UPI001ED88557|nr:craniofacial development protein 2-like [Ischnura elegans]